MQIKVSTVQAFGKVFHVFNIVKFFGESSLVWARPLTATAASQPFSFSFSFQACEGETVSNQRINSLLPKRGGGGGINKRFGGGGRGTKTSSSAFFLNMWANEVRSLGIQSSTTKRLLQKNHLGSSVLLCFPFEQERKNAITITLLFSLALSEAGTGRAASQYPTRIRNCFPQRGWEKQTSARTHSVFPFPFSPLLLFQSRDLCFRLCI